MRICLEQRQARRVAWRDSDGLAEWRHRFPHSAHYNVGRTNSTEGDDEL